jgi:hypothetical protein
MLGSAWGAAASTLTRGARKEHHNNRHPSCDSSPGISLGKVIFPARSPTDSTSIPMQTVEPEAKPLVIQCSAQYFFLAPNHFELTNSYPRGYIQARRGSARAPHPIPKEDHARAEHCAFDSSLTQLSSRVLVFPLTTHELYIYTYI